ncbi:MAG: type IV secretory system conjugative DNA transfer family protein, partial [Desulfofundulus sp.]
MILQTNGAAGVRYANLVVTDPKTELLGVCGPELVKAGYEILVYHPYSPELSDAWNMMAHMKDFETVDDAVVSVIRNTGESKDNYWDNQTNILLDLICYHLRETLGEGASMSHVQAIAGAAKPRDIEVVLKNSKNPKIRANAAGFFSRIGENEKLVSSIMSDLPRRLKLWTLDPIRATTHINEIDFSVLCTDKKVALFVVTPMDKKEQLKPLFATFFTQLFKVVQEKGRELGKLPRPLWFLLDEFANLGTIPNFDNFLTVVRGYRVGVVMGIQSRSQLEELYGKERAKTIIESCATYIISPRIGVEDAKYFSEMLGKATRLTVNKTFTRRLLFYEPEHKEAEAAVPRPLMSPDEIRSLDKDESLLVIAGTRRPVHIAPALYYRDPRWRELGRECYDEKNLQERRLQFYRVNRRKPPLLVPGEEAMMEEAAVVAMPEIIERQSEKVESNADKEKRETGSDTAGNGSADADSKLTGSESSHPGETGSPDKTVRESNNEREPEEKDIQEKNKARHTLDMDSIQITV